MTWYQSARISERITDEKDAAHQILEARRHQVRWRFDEYVDTKVNGELIMAALAYLCVPGKQFWPEGEDGYAPSADPVDNLVEAATFLAAEADRVRRAQIAGKPVSTGLLMLPEFGPDDLVACVDGLREMRREVEQMEAEAG